MTEKLRFIWIDDARQRKSSAKSLSKNLRVNVNFISVEKKKILNEIEKVFIRNDFDLITLLRNFV